MVDIPPTTAVQPVPPATTPATTVTPVETTVNNVPDRIQQLLRQIQVNATVTNLPGDGTVTLNTVLGSLNVLLPTLVTEKQQQLTQQLLGLIETQKPVTVLVQPGNPPTQAFLLLPQQPSSLSLVTNPGTTNTIIENNILLQTASQPRQPIAVGLTLSAVVLPPDIVLPDAPATGQQTLSPVPLTPLTATPPPLGQQATPVPAQPSALPPSNLPSQAAGNLLFEEIAFETLAKAEQSIAETETQITASPTGPPSPLSTIPGAQVPLTSVTQTLTTLPTLPTAALLQPGSDVQLRVDAISLPSTPVTSPLQTVASASLSSPLAPSLPLSLTPSLPLLPLTTTALPTPGPNQVLATVVGSSPGGQLILKAGDATLYVKQSSDLPIGSNLLLTVTQPKVATLPPLPGTPNFNTLQQVLSTLTQIDPQLARAVLENHIPQPTAALPGALLFLMSAFKQGNVRTWLGDDAIDALTRAGKFELIAKLTQELSNNGQSARDAVVGEWRSYPLPLQTNQQFQIMNLYVHDQSQGQKQFSKEAAKAEKAHVRFLIDVRMSKLGPMQLDGFVQTKKLDMMIRSEHGLPEGLHNELRNVYLKALTAIDYAGSLNFQVGRQHWLILQKAAIPATITT